MEGPPKILGLNKGEKKRPFQLCNPLKDIHGAPLSPLVPKV